MELYYKLNSGKNPKYLYYTKSFIRYAMPKFLFRMQRKRLLKSIRKRQDYAYIQERAAYYNKLDKSTPLPPDAPVLAGHRFRQRTGNSVYFFDTYEYTRYFPDTNRWEHLPGDITEVPPYPSIVKSRPIAGDNSNSVLLNLDKVRHFIFLKDHIPFTEKMDKVIFRGKVGGKDKRVRFMNLFLHHPLCDVGDVSKDAPTEWKRPKKTLREHLKYKFIMALEGNDVASNLKWVMSSNSIAVMPRPEYETWFMEGTLIPNVHYIEIKADYSDLEERVNYYITHPEEAQQIINNAHAYIKPFLDKKREKLISLLVLDRYFSLTRDR